MYKIIGLGPNKGRLGYINLRSKLTGEIMSTTTAKGSGSTVNNGGTVLAAGTLSADSPMTKVINLNELAVDDGYGSQVVANDGGAVPGFTDPAGVTTAKSAGTGGLAYFPDAQAGERNFILKAAGDSASKINNDSTTLLNIPGAEYDGVGRETIHKVVSTRRIGSYASASFDVLAVPDSGVVPGRTRGAGAGDASDFVEVDDGSTSASDDAASPTRSVPGELTYHFGGLGRPTTDEYKARDAFEPSDDGSSQTTTTTTTEAPTTTTTTTTATP